MWSAMGLIFFTHRFKITMFTRSNQKLQDSSTASLIVFMNRADKPRETKVCNLPKLILDLLKDSSCLQWTVNHTHNGLGRYFMFLSTDLWLSETNRIFYWFACLQIALHLTINVTIKKCAICKIWGVLTAFKDHLLRNFTFACKKTLYLLSPLF